MDGRSERDELAVRSERAVDRFIGNADASPNFVAVHFATDASTGAYPQASTKYELYFEDDGDPYHDRFPEPIRQPVVLKLARAAKWTDVLSSSLWSEGMLLSPVAFDVFKRFSLANTQQYPAVVQRGKEQRDYTYHFTANHVSIDDLDFKKCEFYIADMLGSPIRLFGVPTAADYRRTRELIVNGELEGFPRFCRLACKSLHFKKKRVPQAATFGLGGLGVEMFVRREVYRALREAGVTGLEFRRNNKLFD